MADTEMTTAAAAKPPRYCANFCEENIWQLAQHIDNPCRVVFISNPNRQVAFWQQQSAPLGEPLIWDYHVVLFEQRSSQVLCHDFDSRLSSGLAAVDYLSASFPQADNVMPQYQPIFKLIDKDRYLNGFASSRQHMRRDQQWLSPPPSWPCIGFSANRSDNLQQFIDSNDKQWGECYSLTALLATLCEPAPFNDSTS